MTLDLGSGMQKFGSGIRGKHPGPATLQKLYVFFSLLTVSRSGHFLHERVLLPVLPGLARTAWCQSRHRLQEGGYRVPYSLCFLIVFFRLKVSLELKGLSHEIDLKNFDKPAATLT